MIKTTIAGKILMDVVVWSSFGCYRNFLSIEQVNDFIAMDIDQAEAVAGEIMKWVAAVRENEKGGQP